MRSNSYGKIDLLSKTKGNSSSTNDNSNENSNININNKNSTITPETTMDNYNPLNDPFLIKKRELYSVKRIQRIYRWFKKAKVIVKESNTTIDHLLVLKHNSVANIMMPNNDHVLADS